MVGHTPKVGKLYFHSILLRNQLPFQLLATQIYCIYALVNSGSLHATMMAVSMGSDNDHMTTTLM